MILDLWCSEKGITKNSEFGLKPHGMK